MRRLKGILVLALLCIAALLAACAQQENPASVKVFASGKGTIVQKDGSRWLITSYVEKDGTHYIDAYRFTVDEQTKLQNSEGQVLSPDDIALGAQVEAWHTGPVQESYPAQANAAKIVVLDDAQEVPEGMIGQAEAVQAALQAPTEPSAAWAVKHTELDSENGHWLVEIVQHNSAEPSAVVRVDARSGKIVRVPVAENDAFRVFSPEPGTEAGPVFTVEGEARVFEAAFSWTLEDGHTILAEGHEMADAGAPEWGRFQFNVSYEQASQPNIMLILYIHSAKDGSVEHELVIPLKAPEEHINYTVE